MNNENLGNALIALGEAFLNIDTPLEQLVELAAKVGLRIKIAVESKNEPENI